MGNNVLGGNSNVAARTPRLAAKLNTTVENLPEKITEAELANEARRPFAELLVT